MHNPYVRQLDGLRFVAVLMVVLAHWVQPLLNSQIFRQIPLHFGVKLFFVLSGYLITGILLKQRLSIERGEVNLKKVLLNFYARRSLRIFPLYYITVIVTVLIGLRYSGELVPWLFTYTTNVNQGIHETYLGEYTHFWSLAVEEQFYLVWPFFILLTPARWFRYSIPTVIVLSLAFRTYALYEMNYFVMAYSTPSALSMLAIGGYLAWMRTHQPNAFNWMARRSIWLMLLPLFLLLHFISLKFGWYWYFNVANGTLFSLCCAALIAACANDGMKGLAGRFLQSEFAVHPGRLSYCIYVVHMFVPLMVLGLLRQVGYEEIGNVPAVLLYFILTYLISVLSWKLIERPFLKLKRRFE